MNISTNTYSKEHKKFLRAFSVNTSKIARPPSKSKPKKQEKDISSDYFSKYFFNEDKECQTPSVTKYTEFEDFLKSHRSSIEKEVNLIFNGCSQGQQSSFTLETNKKTENKVFKFKELIKNAKNCRNVSPISIIKSPISISKARINTKKPVIPCNKYIFSFKKKNISINLSPKESGPKISEIVGSNNYKSVRATCEESREFFKKKKRIKYSSRCSTPVSIFHVQFSIKKHHDFKNSSGIGVQHKNAS